MWKPHLNFVTDAYITAASLLSFLIIYAYGNLQAVDAFFFGCSSSTESGLNTVDVKALETYQQLVIYIIPTITNIGFINIAVVVVRLYWFEKRLRKHAPWILRKRRRTNATDGIHGKDDVEAVTASASVSSGHDPAIVSEINVGSSRQPPTLRSHEQNDVTPFDESGENGEERGRKITWAPEVKHPSSDKALHVPSPLERDSGAPLQEVDEIMSDEDDIDKIQTISAANSGGIRQRQARRLSNVTTSLATSMFILGQERTGSRSRGTSASRTPTNLPQLSSHATEGRNSDFQNLTKEDRENLGGIEYRALWLLLKIIIGYFFGLHLFGAICLVPWIHLGPKKYADYVELQGQNLTWWAFYSAQTMVNNLGFTLTPDSMLSFKDATWPMLIMTFLAFAGNTCYPIMLRLVIWSLTKICPKKSSIQEPLRFLLDHPRRCYTLLFPRKTTWILFGILFALNFIDVLLIIVLDLNNAEVSKGLSPGQSVLAALFQAASSRHTGTASFNLANVNPAVQLSLLVMMYISVFPIAFSIRTSNTYEEQSLGKYNDTSEISENQTGASYLLAHARNQLSFDLWYVFLGVFCICIAESARIADLADPAFTVFAVLFEVVSAYGNVGLSLGYPTNWTSLSGHFTTFSKVVVCLMMIRGRHRGLPHNLDKAITLPGEEFVDEPDDEDQQKAGVHGDVKTEKLKRHNTY